MCPNNMKVVRVQPYGLYVVDPQLSDDERSTELAFPRKETATPTPVIDGEVWMGMCQDFALDSHDDYEEVPEAKVKRAAARKVVATPPPPMDEDVWMAMNNDFACDWREEEYVKEAAVVKPKQILEPTEYGDYTMWGV